nr:hypothetical protein [Tanacetum cinerariifolium]
CGIFYWYKSGISIGTKLCDEYMGKVLLPKVIKDDDDVYYFKFTSLTGLEHVMEQRPWLIHNQPLILTQWTPSLKLSKDKVTSVPIWVKIHKVSVVAYSEDGLSLIGYARALIEVANDKELKEEIIMVVPNLEDEGHTIERMRVEYEWKPP